MTRTLGNPGALKSVPLFSNLTEHELAAMLPSVQQRAYPARACIVRAGDPADGLHVILSGRVKVMLEDGDGREVIVAVFGPREFFGEIGLIDAAPHLSTVRAYDACEILYVPRRAILEWLGRDVTAAMSMLWTITDRLAEAHRKIGCLALVDVYGRVARVLLETACETGGQWLVESGSEQIAAMVGASREMVSRVVKDMITRGVVRRHKRKLIVLNRAALFDLTSRDRHLAPRRPSSGSAVHAPLPSQPGL